VIMAGNHANIPQIAVTTDFASTHSLHSSDEDRKSPRNSILNEQEQTLSPDSEQCVAAPTTPQSGGLQPVHSRSPSDPAFLSPFVISPPSATGGRMSLDVPPRSPSPSYASSIEGSTMAPPSPTLSTQSSVHFATSVALRDNKPGDGTSSLGLLNTDRSVAKHIRKSSWASSGHSSLDVTEPDHAVNDLSSVSMTLGRVGNLIRRHAPVSSRLGGENGWAVIGVGWEPLRSVSMLDITSFWC
jgi:Ca2+-transporting ATPase